MKHLLAAALLLALGGCGTVGLFGTYDLPESDDIDATPWPRLADVPDTPPQGSFSDEVPDPATGIALQTDLSAAANASQARAAALAAPVLTEAERRRLEGARP
ncbi:MAG: hypothetical protein AAGI70_00050 [Pseudomonadota bacterium]